MNLGGVIIILGSMAMVLLLSVFFIQTGPPLLDMHTIVDLGVEKVYCIDNQGVSSKNKLCERKVTCSKWGNVGDFKCSDKDKFLDGRKLE